MGFPEDQLQSFAQCYSPSVQDHARNVFHDHFVIPMTARHYAAEFSYPDKNVHGILCTTVMKAFELTKGSMVFEKKGSGESRSFAKMSSLRRFNQAAYTIPELAHVLRMFQLWAV